MLVWITTGWRGVPTCAEAPMDVQPAGTQIHITPEGDEAFDLLQYLRHDGVHRRTAEALCAAVGARRPATGAAMERQAPRPSSRLAPTAVGSFSGRSCVGSAVPSPHLGQRQGFWSNTHGCVVQEYRRYLPSMPC
jgi:hypothetical protein